MIRTSLSVGVLRVANYVHFMGGLLLLNSLMVRRVVLEEVYTEMVQHTDISGGFINKHRLKNRCMAYIRMDTLLKRLNPYRLL